jgi:hypothetical protein
MSSLLPSHPLSVFFFFVSPRGRCSVATQRQMPLPATSHNNNTNNTTNNTPSHHTQHHHRTTPQKRAFLAFFLLASPRLPSACARARKGDARGFKLSSPPPARALPPCLLVVVFSCHCFGPCVRPHIHIKSCLVKAHKNTIVCLFSAGGGDQGPGARARAPPPSARPRRKSKNPPHRPTISRALLTMSPACGNTSASRLAA